MRNQTRFSGRKITTRNGKCHEVAAGDGQSIMAFKSGLTMED